MDIERAGIGDFEKVRGFYHRLIDDMADSVFHPGWKKGIYPSDDLIRSSLEEGSLFVMRSSGDIIAAMVVNHECNEGYAGVSWSSEASGDEVAMIHALGVMPRFSGRGLAREMARYAISLAKDSGARAVRLDVLKGNLPAEKAYLGAGFRRVGELRMFYEDTGWTDFALFEYLL